MLSRHLGRWNCQRVGTSQKCHSYSTGPGSWHNELLLKKKKNPKTTTTTTKKPKRPLHRLGLAKILSWLRKCNIQCTMFDLPHIYWYSASVNIIRMIVHGICCLNTCRKRVICHLSIINTVSGGSTFTILPSCANKNFCYFKPRWNYRIWIWTEKLQF